MKQLDIIKSLKNNDWFLKAACLLLVMLFVCAGTTLAQDKKIQKEETVVFYVENLNCKNCQATIEKYIAFEKGVKDLQTELEKKTVKVTYDPSKTDPQKLMKGFEKIKFPAVIAPPQKATLRSDN